MKTSLKALTHVDGSYHHSQSRLPEDQTLVRKPPEI